MTDAPKIDTQAPDYKGFTEAIMEEWQYHCDIDAATKFDLAVKHHIIREIPGGYNRGRHEDTVGVCPNEGDPWYEMNDAPDLSAAREADLQSRLDETTRRRDAWREKAEGYDELAAAVRAGIEEAGDRDLSRVFLRGALVDSERRLKEEQERADARAAAAAQAMREAAAMTGHAQADGNTRHAVLRSIRDLPLPDPAALDRLIAERVREAVEAEREACAKVADDGANTYRTMERQAWDCGRTERWEMMRHSAEGSELIAANIRARGSKEGQS